MLCRVCSASSQPFGRATVLGRHSVQYFQCLRCGFIQTETPYWLEDAYASAITRSDLGLISRNLLYARIAPLVIATFFNRQTRFLDYGGGYGMFVRLMRDYGFDFFRQDRYAENLFAAGFDADDHPDATYELVTAFEVFEHLAQPLAEIEQMLRFSRNVLFSTQLLPTPAPDLNTWWYYGLDHGQHLALYTRESLRQLGRHFGLNVYSCGSALHLLTEKRLPPAAFAVIGRIGRVVPWLASLLHPHSLLSSDYAALTGKRLGSG